MIKIPPTFEQYYTIFIVWERKIIRLNIIYYICYKNIGIQSVTKITEKCNKPTKNNFLGI